jgi:hypothetical protein
MQAAARDLVHCDAALVPEQQAVIRLEHAWPVDHIVKHGVELLHRRGGVAIRIGGMQDARRRLQQMVDGVSQSEREFVADIARSSRPAPPCAYAPAVENTCAFAVCVSMLLESSRAWRAAPRSALQLCSAAVALM